MSWIGISEHNTRTTIREIRYLGVYRKEIGKLLHTTEVGEHRNESGKVDWEDGLGRRIGKMNREDGEVMIQWKKNIRDSNDEQDTRKNLRKL